MTRGVAYPFWQRCEDERIRRGLTKSQLSDLSGLPRTTYNDLERTTRPPLPRIVHALADALGIDRHEAEVLAGLRRPSTGQAPSVREAIMASGTLTPSNKRTMIELYEQLTAANQARIASERPTPIEGDRSDDEQQAI